MGLENAGRFRTIVIDPGRSRTPSSSGVFGHDWAPNSERGVFRTTDGGQTWSKSLFVNDTTGVCDLVMEPGNPRSCSPRCGRRVVTRGSSSDGGAGSGLYRSTDGGCDVEEADEGPSGGPDRPDRGRVGADEPAARLRPVRGEERNALGVARPRRRLEGSHATTRSSNVRPFYFSRLFVSPEDERRLYFLSFQLVESDDGGKTARAIDKGVHVGPSRAVDRPHEPVAHDPGQRRRRLHLRRQGQDLALPRQPADRAVLHGRRGLRASRTTCAADSRTTTPGAARRTA